MRKIYKFTSEKTDTVLNIFKDKDGFWTGIWINPTIFIVNKNLQIIILILYIVGMKFLII